jgi:hypothetical protein
MSFLSDSVIERVAGRVERGVPLQTALKAAGVTDEIVREWGRIASGTQPDEAEIRERIVAFTERIGIAQAECEAVIVAGIAETSATIGKGGLPEWRAGAWLLNNHPEYRETYRQQREMKVTGEVTHTHEHMLVQQNSSNLALLEQWAALPEVGEPS